MADAKLSSYPTVTSVVATTKIAGLNPGNVIMTAGQLRQYVLLPTTTSIVSGVIPQTYSVVGVSGECTLTASTVVGTRITLVSTAAGKIISIGYLPSDGFTFVGSGATVELIWFNSVWNILSVNGMTTGVI